MNIMMTITITIFGTQSIAGHLQVAGAHRVQRAPPSPRARDLSPCPPSEVATKAFSRAVEVFRHAILGVVQGPKVGGPASVHLGPEHQALPLVQPRGSARVAVILFRIIEFGLHHRMARVGDHRMARVGDWNAPSPPNAARHLETKPAPLQIMSLTRLWR